MATIALRTTVTNTKTNRPISIMRALVDQKPISGWTYDFTIKGVAQKTVGNSPAAVAASTRGIYTRNKEEWCEDDFWISVNLQWLAASHPRHHLVSIKELAGMQAEGEEVPLTEPVVEWEYKGWRFVGLVLAQDKYHAPAFTTAFHMVVEMLDPKRNSRLGSKFAHAAAMIAAAELMSKTPASQQLARTWFFKFLNSEKKRAGKKPIGYQETATQNHWV